MSSSNSASSRQQLQPLPWLTLLYYKPKVLQPPTCRCSPHSTIQTTVKQHSIITPSTSYTDTVEFSSVDDEIKAFNNHFYHITVSSPEYLRHSYEIQEQNTFTSLEDELQAFNENYLKMTTSSPDDWEDWFDEKSSSTFSTSSPTSSYEWLDYSPVSIAESTAFQLVNFKATLEVFEPSQSITYSDLTIVEDYRAI